MLIALLVPLSLAILTFGLILLRAAIAKHATPNREAMLVGAIVSFFDTLGIGSFAPTTAWLKFRKIVPDRLIPGTRAIAWAPPIASAFGNVRSTGSSRREPWRSAWGMSRAITFPG